MLTKENTSPIDAAEIDVRPAGPPIIEEVNPDVKLLLTLSWYVTQTWNMVSVGSVSPSGSGYNLYTEYWGLDSTFLGELEHATGGDSITLAPVTYASPWPTAPFTNPTISLWTEITAAPSGAVFSYVDANTNTYIALSFNLQSGSPWTGSLTWLAGAPAGGSGPPSSIIGSTSITLAYQTGAPSLPTGYAWFYQRLPALTWPSSPSVIGDATLGSSLATMGSYVYLADVKSNGVIHVRSSSTGSSFGGPADTGISGAQGGPALAALGSTLYLVYSDDGSYPDTLRQSTSTNGTTWSSPVATGVDSAGSPALANVVSGFSNTLCLAYPSLSTPSDILTRAWSGTAWSSASTAATTASGSPALAAFGGALYMAIATSGGLEVHKAQSVSSSGVTWPSSGDPIATLAPPRGATWSGPGLSVWQGQLALTFKDGNGHVWACFSSDGILWSGYQDLSSQVTTVGTDVAPVAGAIGSTLVLAFNGTVSGSTGLGTIAAT